MLAAAILTAAITVEIDLTALIAKHRMKAGVTTCGIRTVGYRFAGKPGQEFRYAGDTYRIPQDGAIELIADRRDATYRIDNRTLPLDGVEPLDQFGFRDVALPTSATH